MIANAKSAAPEAIAAAASVIAFDANGKPRTLHKGTNNFTCIPDDPTNPANDPSCMDENGLAWVMAWIGKTEPPEGQGRLRLHAPGRHDPEQCRPVRHATARGGGWMQEPPHVMIFNYGGAQDYPKPGEAPDMTQSWVMWAGTPYEHLMLPVK